MTGSQYKNIINQTIFMLLKQDGKQSLDFIRQVFNNLGVALPQGDLRTIINKLKSNNFMGWRQCSQEQAQRYADSGITAIAISDKMIVVIYPNEKTSNLSCDADPTINERNNIMTVYENASCNKDMLFFAYSYGYEI